VAAVLLIGAVGGAGTMIVELAAVRLLAPWFGTSLVVWTNVIAVILLALALGYLAGGWLAGRTDPWKALGAALISAGIVVAWLPVASAPIARAFLPSEVALVEAARLVAWCSLAVALLLFLLPAALLGAVSPLAVEAVAGRTRHAGLAGGAVLCASTLGSLVGVFGTSHVFLPRLGLARTFLLAGALLVLAGTAAWLLARRRARSAGIAALGLGAAFVVGEPSRPALADGTVELAAQESAYQSLRVVEDRSSVPALRYLRVNEGFDSYQSVWQEAAGLLPEGFYYNDFALPIWCTPAPSSWRVLVLGLGAGTAWRVLEGASPPGARIAGTGVEIDPAVVALGREYFDLREIPSERRILAGLDARVALRCLGERFEQVILDCYANQVEIPSHLCTLEFFREIRLRLVEGGWLTANLGGFGFDDPVVQSVARTCADAFEGPVLLLRVPRARNFTLIARERAPLPFDEGCPVPDSGPLAGLVAPRELPGFVQRVGPGSSGVLQTDDHCSIESLQLRSILRAEAAP
jgi:spermidine synthase